MGIFLEGIFLITFPIVSQAFMRNSKLGFLDLSIGVGTVTINTSASQSVFGSFVKLIFSNLLISSKLISLVTSIPLCKSLILFSFMSNPIIFLFSFF